MNRWNGKPAIIKYDGPAPLTLAERRWVAERLNNAGIATPAMDRPDHDIPLVIADREIMMLFQDTDRRAVDLLESVPVAPEPLQEPGTPSVLARHAQRPSWFQANREEVWTWIAIGVGGLALAEVVGLLIFGMAVS